MNNLEKVIATYLQYDQKADDRWHDPSPDNKDYHDRVKKDAENIAKIAVDTICNGDLDKSKLFSFMNFVKKHYEYVDNNLKGDVYIDKVNGVRFSEHEVFVKWKIKYYGK